ncbi:MAG: helix-turn-helix domain-containing protein [Ignavibacteriae bacterium]|nr:helix-turn-helix domain-containing protein [Ignavibacteriota bacterium]
MQDDPHRTARNLPKLLTPPEAAAFLRISRASLYRLVDTRKIPFYRVSRSLRFSEEDLNKYLSGHRTEQIV